MCACMHTRSLLEHTGTIWHVHHMLSLGFSIAGFLDVPKLAVTIALQHTGGAAPIASAQSDVTVEEHITKFAGRMGNIVANSMAGGFGATLGRRAAHSVWNGMTGR